MKRISIDTRKEGDFNNFKKSWFLPVVGTIAALAISPFITAITGKENAYALVLLPLNLLLWAITRLSSRDMGIKVGPIRPYIWSFLYPIAIMGITGFIVWSTGKIQTNTFLVAEIGKRILVLFLIGIIGTLLTEEGFFRGWLWGILEKTRSRLWIRLVWTSAFFCLWHYAVTIILFNLPKINIPVYLGNILLIGLIFGLLRQMSGSIIVPAVSHALWNALSYTLYGMGEKAGALNIASRQLFDPEIGLLGLLLNFIAVVLFWRIAIKKEL